jgi:8-oxo-dGTP pyrophosphatase MutT (NUDIX family)
MLPRSSLRTLVFVIDKDRILLGRKKRGFGAGKINGFGGKLQPGETLEAAAARELTEEAHITAEALEHRGTLSFTFANGLDPLQVEVFVASAWQGEAQETEEMAPAWFPLDSIPYSEMWVDDPHWLPLLLADQHFIGQFLLKDTEELLSAQVNSVAPEALPRHHT